LAEILIVQFKYTHTILNYQLIFHELKPDISEKIFENKHLMVETIPLDHRIDCTGFLFREKKKPFRLDKEKLPSDLTLKQIASLKKGEDIMNGSGEVKYRNSSLTLKPRKSRSYAYCSDTRYNESILKQIKNVDVLYHEATFLKEKSERAASTYHSTAEQAATIASKASAGTLMLGHFSTRYKDLEPVLEEARTVFDNTIIAEEGLEITIRE
jgi:ribonuclease Z